jgi:hypothetical protein
MACEAAGERRLILRTDSGILAARHLKLPPICWIAEPEPKTGEKPGATLQISGVR